LTSLDDTSALYLSARIFDDYKRDISGFGNISMITLDTFLIVVECTCCCFFIYIWFLYL